jgi:hypothetical protein
MSVLRERGSGVRLELTTCAIFFGSGAVLLHLVSSTQSDENTAIASVRTHGVRQLLVYCNGKRESDWLCHGELPIEQFSAKETLPDLQRRWRTAADG